MCFLTIGYIIIDIYISSPLTFFAFAYPGLFVRFFCLHVLMPLCPRQAESRPL